MQEILNYINGEFQASVSGKSLDNISPATNKRIAEIPASDKDDIELAVNAALTAQPAWGALSFTERAGWLERIADSLEARSDDIAHLESMDTGKPISIAKATDAARSVANFRFFADLVREHRSEKYEMADATNEVILKPVGIAGLITPWNLPLYLLSWKAAPALAMGNAVIAKPSELTPLTANLLAEVIDDVGLPAGLVNIVHGYGPQCGQALVEHPDVRSISFTGGTETGRKVAASAAPMFKKLSLELGGKNASIILEDANLDSVIPDVARAAFFNQGQVCLSGSRILIADSLWDDFVPLFTAHVAKMQIGDPSDENTELGALVSLEHRDKVEEFISRARENGGRVLMGGKRPELAPPFNAGAFLEPTVICGLSHLDACATQEAFGPVVTLHPFHTEEEAIEMTNSVDYGLAGSVWTNNPVRGAALASRIDSGMIWVNCWLHRDLRVPFGGVKDSGLGREGGRYSLEFFSEAQNICIHD